MEIIDENVTDLPQGRGRPSQYPWDKWLQANTQVRIFQGRGKDDDFTIEPSSLRPQIHNRAKARGGKASTSLGDKNGRKYIDIIFTPGMSEADIDADLTFEKTG